MEQDRVNEIKANSVHVDDNFNTLLDSLNRKLEIDGSVLPIADLSMDGNKITELGTPTVSADAATKGYVDTSVNNARVPATNSILGQVIIGENISIDSAGVISVPDASTEDTGAVKLGRTNTIANAAEIAVRPSSITNTIPTTGEDGVIYFVYAL